MAGPVACTTGCVRDRLCACGGTACLRDRLQAGPTHTRSGSEPTRIVCPMTETYRKYLALATKPGGKRLFSLAYARFAPYFWTVRPQVREVRANYAELSIRKRRAVHNHIGTFHVIAVANGLEAAMGLLAEATVPDTKRWIPRGMELTYPAKATTDLLCIAESDPENWQTTGDVPVRVKALRTDGTVVVAGTIMLYVSDKPSKTH